MRMNHVVVLGELVGGVEMMIGVMIVVRILA